MAINSQKLLPQAKLTSTKVNVEKKNVLLKKELINIRKTLINIDKLLLSNSLFNRKETELKRKDTEKQRFKEKETRLEKKKEKEITKDNESSVPQLGIFDRINRFITFTFLGFLFNKFSKYLPKILEFIKKIQPVAEFIESFVGNVFNGIVNFIDFGYSASKKVSNFAKQIGGENFQKTFDEFSGNLTKFINLAIVVGMATMGGTDFGLGKKGGKPGTERRPKVTKSGGGGVGKPNLRNPLRQRPNITKSKGSTVRKFGGKFAGKVFGKIPIIGGLVSFIISVLSGEPVGRAAAKAVGFSIGSALGTFIPIPFAGTILGGILGDIVGGALYDTIVGSKPERKKVQGRNKGGPVTRGRKKVGGVVKRTVRVTKAPPKVPLVKPGESIGGKKNLQKIFPEPVGQQKGKTVNPYGFLTDTANSLLGTDIAGALGAVFIKPFLGQLPTKGDYKNFGLAMNIWISNARSKGFIGGNATGGFADGGIINNGMMGDISKWAEKSIEEMIKNKVTDAINDLRKNLGLKPLSSTESVSGDMGEGMGLYVSSNSPDFWLLATAALFENSNPQGAADVAQAIYNRVAMPGDPWKVNNSIRTAILNPGQFQPVRQYGGTASWAAIKTKDDALRFINSHGKTQAQLETVAAALLDKEKQNVARQFVGPRDSFRSVSYEDANNHLADDTEVRRHGHVFGFEPRGATISSFRAGKLSAAMVTDQITGDVKFGNQSGNLNLAKELGTSMGLNITSMFRQGDRGYHGSGRAVDFQTPGKPGNRGTPGQMAYAREVIRRYGTTIKELIYTPLGFGIKNGKQVPLTTWGPLSPPWADLPDGDPLKNSTNAIHYDHVHVAFKDGGSVGFDKKSKNIRPLQNFTSYDQGSTFAILPIETIRTVPIQSPSQNKIAFTGSGGGGVNSNDTNKSRMFVG